jgi:hypothetical protein
MAADSGILLPRAMRENLESISDLVVGISSEISCIYRELESLGSPESPFYSEIGKGKVPNRIGENVRLIGMLSGFVGEESRDALYLRGLRAAVYALDRAPLELKDAPAYRAQRETLAAELEKYSL